MATWLSTRHPLRCQETKDARGGVVLRPDLSFVNAAPVSRKLASYTKKRGGLSTTIVTGSWCWVRDYDAEQDRYTSRQVFVCSLLSDERFKSPHMIVCYGRPSVDQDQSFEKLSAATSWTLSKDFVYISIDCVIKGFADMPENGRLVVLDSLKESVTLRSDLCRAEDGVEQNCKVYCEPKESDAPRGKKRAMQSSSRAPDNFQPDGDQDDEEFIPERVKSKAAEAVIDQESNATSSSSRHAYVPVEQATQVPAQQPNENKQADQDEQDLSTGGDESSQQPVVATAQAPQRLPWLDELQQNINDPQTSYLGICKILENWSESVTKELKELESKMQGLKSSQEFANGVWKYVTYLRMKKEGGRMPTFLAGHPFVEPMEELGRKLRADGFKLERPDE